MGDPERRGDDKAGADGERAPLGILFLAAAVGLALLLVIVALLAFAAMAPRAPDVEVRTTEAKPRA